MVDAVHGQAPAYKVAKVNNDLLGQGHVVNGKSFTGSTQAIAHFKAAACTAHSARLTVCKPQAAPLTGPVPSVWYACAEATVRNVAQELRSTLESEVTVKELLTKHFNARGLADTDTPGRLSRDAESNKLGDEARQRTQQRAKVRGHVISACAFRLRMTHHRPMNDLIR